VPLLLETLDKMSGPRQAEANGDMAEEENNEQKTVTNEKPEKKLSKEWVCPECKRRLTLYLAPSAYPTCANPEVHGSKTVIMEPR